MRKFAIRLAIIYLLPVVPLIAYSSAGNGSTFGKELRELAIDLFESFARGGLAE